MAEQVSIISADDFISQNKINSNLNVSDFDKLFFAGNVSLINNSLLAVFCSGKCPGSIILKTYDLVKQFREPGVTVISQRLPFVHRT